MNVLVVDNNAQTTSLMELLLQHWGYRVYNADNGNTAWEIINNKAINLIITALGMPEMDGLELCRKIRSADFDHYVYIIILTAKDQKNELMASMHAGADDFLLKPFRKDELKIRIKAVTRILELEDILEKRNRKLHAANQALKKASAIIQRDLKAAARIQESLLPRSATTISGVCFEWLFLPSTMVAGDIFNYFALDESHLAFYLLDVSGHGIPAAMLSVAASKVLFPSNAEESLLKNPSSSPPYYKIVAPSHVAATLNQRFQSQKDVGQYFTIIYGVIDVYSGECVITQAGHPPPLLLSKDGKGRFIGQGGYPVGMLPDLEYEDIEFKMAPGDRLFLYSDGVTECSDSRDIQFSKKRLMRLVQKNRKKPLNTVISHIEEKLYQWKGKSHFEDDISLLGLEFNPSQATS